jgi:hypothetical protein
MVRHGATLLVVLTLLACVAGVAHACPQCQKALAGSEGGVGGNIVRGYFWSILFMLSMPFVLLTSFSTYFYLLIRKARKNPQPLSAAVLAAQQGVAPSHVTIQPLPAGSY